MNTANCLPTQVVVHGNQKRARKIAFDPNQMGLFAALDSMADDILAGSRVAEIADSIDLGTNKVLNEKPELLGIIDDDQREKLNFARFLHSADIPSAEVHAILTSTIPDADNVMNQLDVIESALETDDVVEGDDAFEDDEPQDQVSTVPMRPGLMKAIESAGANATALYLSTLRSSRFDPLTAKQEADLGVRIRNGDMSARDELVNHNMRYMVSVARKYIKTGRPFDDLIQAGSEGLITSAEKFDPALGRFTTIAAWWIRQRIQRSVAEDANMPLPAYLPGQEAKLKRLAEAATSAEEKAHLESRAESAGRNLESRRRVTISLDASTSGEDDGDDLLSTLQSECIGQEERVAHLQVVSKLQHFANRLGDDRSKNVFLMRIGMHPDYIGESRTLAEISDDYDLTRERVRQIYAEAAKDIATAMEFWAKGAENLPAGFRKGLLNPGKA